jgi:sugar/nucleoside kinase (ribokinase family)
MLPDPTPTPQPEARHLDLLVVGALTVDHFADGSRAAGGSAMHATRAATSAGYTTAVLTVAGHEPEATAGLAELATTAALHVVRAEHSVSFGHRDTSAGRELVLESTAPTLVAPAADVAPRAALFAPVAGEFGADLAGHHYDIAVRGAILQGWLRSLDPGRRVEPLSLGALADDLVAVLAGFDILTASTEDLRAVAGSPAAQLDALRDHFGDRPLLVVTDGAAGAWLDGPIERQRIVPRSIVESASTVGAGDAFAAVMLVELSRGRAPVDAAQRATEAVVRLLTGRRR